MPKFTKLDKPEPNEFYKTIAQNTPQSKTERQLATLIAQARRSGFAAWIFRN